MQTSAKHRLRDVVKGLDKDTVADSVIIRRDDGETHQFFTIKYVDLYKFVKGNVTFKTKKGGKTINTEQSTYHEILSFYQGQRVKLFLDIDFHGTMANVSNIPDSILPFNDSLESIKKAYI